MQRPEPCKPLAPHETFVRSLLNTLLDTVNSSDCSIHGVFFPSAPGAGIAPRVEFICVLVLRMGQPSTCSCQPEPRRCPLLALVHARPEAATAGKGGRDAMLLTLVLLKHAIFDLLHIKGLFCRLFVICSFRQLFMNQSLRVCLDRADQIWTSNLRPITKGFFHRVS